VGQHARSGSGIRRLRHLDPPPPIPGTPIIPPLHVHERPWWTGYGAPAPVVVPATAPPPPVPVAATSPVLVEDAGAVAPSKADSSSVEAATATSERVTVPLSAVPSTEVKTRGSGSRDSSEASKVPGDARAGDKSTRSRERRQPVARESDAEPQRNSIRTASLVSSAVAYRALRADAARVVASRYASPGAGRASGSRRPAWRHHLRAPARPRHCRTDAALIAGRCRT
jgi:hypothetical protein